MTKSILAAAATAALLALPALAWSQDRPRPAPAAAAPAAAAPAAAGAPVAADPWPLDAREDWLVGRLHRAQDEHDIADADADKASKDLASIRERAKAISDRRNRPLTAGETGAQKGRVDAIVAQIHLLSGKDLQKPW